MSSMADKALEKMNVPAKAQPKTLAHASSGSIKDMLSQYQDQIAMALPQHMTPERVIQLATTVIAANPAIKGCTPQTVIGCVMQSSILGLDLTPQLGQCFLIPRNNGKTGLKEATFMIGYKGYLQLIRRSGEILSIYAHVVRTNDFFTYELGLGQKLDHIPAKKDRGALEFVYAVAKMKSGETVFEVMDKAQVMHAKASSASAKRSDSVWITDEESMWRKTGIRKIQNYLPLSTEFFKASVTDGAAINVGMFTKEAEGLDVTQVEPEHDEPVEAEPAMEIIPEVIQPEPEPEQPKPVEQAGKKPFVERVQFMKAKIIEKKGEEFWVNTLGGMGYESLDQVPPAEQKKVEMDLLKVVNDLIVKK